MQNASQLKIEVEFLILCGFDISNGYWQENLDYYISQYPWLWDNLMKLRNNQ